MEETLWDEGGGTSVEEGDKRDQVVEHKRRKQQRKLYEGGESAHVAAGG